MPTDDALAALVRVKNLIGTYDLDLHLDEVHADIDIVAAALAKSDETQTPAAPIAPKPHVTYHPAGLVASSLPGHDMVRLTWPSIGTIGIERIVLEAIAREHGSRGSAQTPTETGRGEAIESIRAQIRQATVDDLAADIREIDGDHAIGASTLAEALIQKGWRR